MITTVCKISYGSQTVPPIVPAVQGDTGRAISFEIADFTPPAGATATYFILKPSGEAIYNSATITDNSILCELTAQSLAEAGENRMQVRVLQGEDIVTSFEVILMVRTFLGDDAIESGTEMNIFDQAVEQATEQFQENAEQIVAEVIQSIPSDYTELTEEVNELNERINNIKPGLSDDAKQALLTCLEHLVWKDATGRSLYNNLVAALYTSNLVVIFSPTETIYDYFTLTDIKQYLEVRLYNSAGEYEVIDEYSLTGTLNQSRSILTVAHDDMITTFPVAVKVGRLLMDDDIMSNLGYTNFEVSNGDVLFDSIQTFSACVLNPTIRHIRFTHDSAVINPTPGRPADRLDRPFWAVFSRGENQVYVTDSTDIFIFSESDDKYSATKDNTLADVTNNAVDMPYNGTRFDYELSDNVLTMYSIDGGSNQTVNVTNAALIGLWCSTYIRNYRTDVRIYDEDRFLTIDDIASSRGLGGLTVDNHGSIVPTSWTTFSIIDFASSITKIKYYASTVQTGTVNANVFFVFRKISDDEYYCCDGVSGNLFRFTWNNEKNAYDAVTDNTIATVTVENGEAFSMYQYRTLELEDGHLIMKSCNGGRIIVDNANCIGFWSSSAGASRLQWLEVVVQS